MLIKRIKNYIFFASYLLINPHLLILPLRGIYLPVYIQFEWLKKYNIKTIVDVGASRGDVSKSLNYLFPNAKIYAFEPIEENYKLLAKSITATAITINKIALSNRNGKSAFYLNKYLPASSLLPLDEKYRQSHNFMTHTKKVEVKTTTLDSYFKDKELEKMIFLKIDTQGTEDLILRGGKKFLSSVSIIHIETSFDIIYQNQGAFSNIYEILTKLKFKHMGEVRESQFYPTFGLKNSANSIFINTKN